MFGKPVTLHLESLWIKNITIATGLVDTYSTPKLLQMLAEGQIDTQPLITHHLRLDEMMAAYDVFAETPGPTAPSRSSSRVAERFRTLPTM